MYYCYLYHHYTTISHDAPVTVELPYNMCVYVTYRMFSCSSLTNLTLHVDLTRISACSYALAEKTHVYTIPFRRTHVRKIVVVLVKEADDFRFSSPMSYPSPFHLLPYLTPVSPFATCSSSICGSQRVSPSSFFLASSSSSSFSFHQVK